MTQQPNNHHATARLLIDAAAAAARWVEILDWYGDDVEYYVAQDLAWLDSVAVEDLHERAEDLYSRCVNGCKDGEEASCREYVDDLRLAVEAEPER